MYGLTLGANLPSGCNFQDVSDNIVCTWAWYAAPQVCMLALPSVLKREAAQGFGVSPVERSRRGLSRTLGRAVPKRQLVCQVFRKLSSELSRTVSRSTLDFPAKLRPQTLLRH